MVSTVSTRGVKFKFSEGERVLCYEPDPTKAKVLYESKVLQLVVNRDERGRKVPEYLIHFFGWNSSWDRCVREEFILSYTEENCELQAKLATEAALSIKGKHKIKLPPLIKETLAKKQCMETDKPNSEKSEKKTDSSSDKNSSEDESEKEVIIDIPDVLKQELEEDFKNINKKDKFVKLPCTPNVIAILEAYVKHLASKLLSASPPKNSKNGTQLMPEDVKNKLNLCKEAMDGIRVYFDFTLPHLLLYRQEKNQRCTTELNSTPISSFYKWEPKENVENVMVKVDPTDNEIALNSQKNMKVLPIVKMENILSTHSRCRKSLLWHSSEANSLVKQENFTNGQAEKKSENSYKTKKLEKNKKSSKEEPNFTPTRILRSSEKLKVQPPKDDSVPNCPSSPSPPNIVGDCKRIRSANPIPVLPIENSNPPRLTRKLRQQSLSPTSFSNPTIQIQTPPTLVENKLVPTTSIASNNPIRASSSYTLATNYVSSSNSSSHSTFSNLNSSHLHQMKNEAFLEETLLWRLLPQHMYECIPAPPSLVYGAQHLLRLFVKLPDLLSKMNMSRKKMTILLDILESFLLFMVEKRSEFFLQSAYFDYCDEELDVCSTK